MGLAQGGGPGQHTSVLNPMHAVVGRAAGAGTGVRSAPRPQPGTAAVR